MPKLMFLLGNDNVISGGLMKNIAVFFRFSAYLFMAFSLLLIGCASKLPPKTTKVEHYPMCYKPIQDLRDTEFLVAKYTAEGALLGALGGGLGCALSDIQGGNNPDAKKAATCAAVGAAAGAFAGYFVGKSEEKTTVERLTQHVKDVDDYKGKLDRRAASARNAQQCYSNSFDTAVANYKAKKISKETFEKQYVEISSGVAEANSLLEYDMAAGRKMQEDYQKERGK